MMNNNLKYKLSNYIYAKEEGDVVLLYAMIKDSCFALSKEKYDLLLQENLHSVEKINRNLFSAMKKIRRYNSLYLK